MRTARRGRTQTERYSGRRSITIGTRLRPRARVPSSCCRSRTLLTRLAASRTSLTRDFLQTCLIGHFRSPGLLRTRTRSRAIRSIDSFRGGTGACFIYLGTGDIAFYSDGNGNPVTPPAGLIEDPEPWPGSNNWYKRDGYESGSYVNCADQSQPGVAPILAYLRSRHLQSRCDPGHYYLVNNYGPAYDADGTPVNVRQHPYTLPPQTLPNIAEALSAAGVSWKYYIGGLKRPGARDAWCSICNPLQYSKRVMTGPLRENITDVSDFYRDIDNGKLPEVSFVRPYEPYSGHPANSAASAYEYFVLSIANYVIAKPELFASTAIMATFDEGGGYYDSGYIQTLDFFGDGTRIPLLVISPYVIPGSVDHAYSDHASILKFIEANWGLRTLSPRSRDNLPNPVASRESPYIPSNGPALGDLMSIFDFAHKQYASPLIIPGAI